MNSIFIFPPDGEKYGTNPSDSSSTIADVFRRLVPGWSTEACLMNVVTDKENFVLIYDVKCWGEPQSPYNRAYEQWAHQGQLTSAIQLLRGPVVMLAKPDVDVRDCVEQHYLKTLNEAKRRAVNNGR